MIALALFAIVVTALAAYSLGHSAGVKLERGRHHLAPTMKTVAAVKEAVDRAAEVGR